jgi:excisionase family DNA binding protein
MASDADSQAPNGDELLTVEQVASRLKLKPATVRGKIAAGELPVTKLGDGDKPRLMRDQQDSRYDRAATKWAGRGMVERPRLGLKFAGEVVRALRDIDGV